jgi:hypothetical protein
MSFLVPAEHDLCSIEASVPEGMLLTPLLYLFLAGMDEVLLLKHGGVHVDPSPVLACLRDQCIIGLCTSSPLAVSQH